jgi:prenyltransferase beta subunit
LTGPTEPPPKLLPPIDPNPSPRSIPWASLPIGSGARTPFGITNSIAKWNPDKISPINNAVLLALRWLKKYQQPDGSWTGTAPPAMTALALLAFLGHAEKPDSAEFGPTVKRAILWLLANQEETGRFKGRDGNDYTQPIAAYALCEAAFMTGHPDVRAAAEQAVAVIVRGQHDNGGFNYNLNQENRNDTSYMAWCAQAMKAAEVAKLDVADLGPAAKRAIGGFRGNADPRGGFGYTGPERTGLSGAGALCMQLLGAGDAREVRDTIAFLAPATFNFEKWDKQPYSGASPLYYWYYITQAKYQHSKETFAGWNNLFVPELIRRQILEKQAIEGPDGKPADIGHWESPSKSEHTGGVVQDTCLCTLMLEVFYRYLPSYQQVASRGE